MEGESEFQRRVRGKERNERKLKFTVGKVCKGLVETSWGEREREEMCWERGLGPAECARIRV